MEKEDVSQEQLRVAQDDKSNKQDDIRRSLGNAANHITLAAVTEAESESMDKERMEEHEIT